MNDQNETRNSAADDSPAKQKIAEKEKPDADDLKKGYNEKNPTEPQGAFTPDSKKS